MRSMKHLLTLYCVRYQECISHYSVIAVIYICPDEQHGRKIMKLREKKGSTANEWFILSAELSSTSSYSFFPFHSSTYSFFFCSVLYLLVIIFFSPLYVLSASFSLLVWSGLSHLKEDNKNNINNKKKPWLPQSTIQFLLFTVKILERGIGPFCISSSSIFFFTLCHLISAPTTLMKTFLIKPHCQEQWAHQSPYNTGLLYCHWHC